MSHSYLFTSESVSEGHPDKIADQISDAVLDAIIEQDAKARVACETMSQQTSRVTCGPVTELPEVPNLIHRQRISGQMQQTVKQHRAVAVRQDEAITVPPLRITRVVL